MNKRYSDKKDQYALDLLADTKDTSLPTGLAVYGRGYDQECDIADVLVGAGAKNIEVHAPQTITCGLLISPTFSAGAVRARLSLAIDASEVDRLIAHLREAPTEVIVIENVQRLARSQLLLLSSALSKLQSDPDWKKKVVLLIVGHPSDFDELLQSNASYWTIRVCPRLEDEDVVELMSKFGITIDPSPTLSSVLLDFSRHAPHGLIALATLAQKRKLKKLGYDDAQKLINALDSQAHMRGKFAHLSFVSIKAARKKKKSSKLTQTTLPL